MASVIIICAVLFLFGFNTWLEHNEKIAQQEKFSELLDRLCTKQKLYKILIFTRPDRHDIGKCVGEYTVSMDYIQLKMLLNNLETEYSYFEILSVTNESEV